MKKLLLILFVFGCMACQKKEAPAMEEPADMSADTTAVMEEAPADTAMVE